MFDGFRYLLTCIDRFTRWPEAIPLTDISAESITSSFCSGWIARFGIPEEIVTDQGRQFESRLFNDLLKTLGIKRSRTTPYNPAANGLIERWHRTLKASLKCNDQRNWVKSLPIVLLGLRSVFKPDLQATVSEMVYGKSLRLPGEFLIQSQSKPNPVSSSFTLEFQNLMCQLRPVETSHHSNNQPFIFNQLRDCTHVFVRVDAVKASLQAPYDGPFKVVSRAVDLKTFEILIKNQKRIINVNRLKPAFVEFSFDSQQSSSDTTNKPIKRPRVVQFTESPINPVPSKITTTRSGRRVKTPERFVP